MVLNNLDLITGFTIVVVFYEKNLAIRLFIKKTFAFKYFLNLFFRTEFKMNPMIMKTILIRINIEMWF